MLFDLINLSKLRRTILYALLLAVLFIVQDLAASHVTVFGVRPLLIPAAVVAVGLLDGGLWGGFFGIAAGFFYDMGCSEHIFLFTVTLAVIGFFVGVLGQFLFHRGFVSYFVLTIAAIAVVTYCQMFRFLFFTDTDPAAVWRTGLIQFLWSLPWSIPVYFPCRSIAGQFSR